MIAQFKTNRAAVHTYAEGGQVEQMLGSTRDIYHRVFISPRVLYHLCYLVSNFLDSEIGCVTGNLVSE